MGTRDIRDTRHSQFHSHWWCSLRCCHCPSDRPAQTSRSPPKSAVPALRARGRLGTGWRWAALRSLHTVKDTAEWTRQVVTRLVNAKICKILSENWNKSLLLDCVYKKGYVKLLVSSNKSTDADLHGKVVTSSLNRLCVSPVLAMKRVSARSTSLRWLAAFSRSTW